MQSRISKVNMVKNISTRPLSSLCINILFVCFTFGLQYFISKWSCQVLKKSWCWLWGPNSGALIGVLQFAYWAMWEALLLWASVVGELFVYSFQRFSWSCARYLVLYYYKPQQIASLCYLLFPKDREKYERVNQPLFTFDHTRETRLSRK